MTDWELLLALVRPKCNPAEISRPGVSDIHWQGFQELSSRHDLNSFVASQLLKLLPDLLPDTIAGSIRLRFAENTARQMRAEHQLAALAAAFDSAGLPLLSFKGPTLVRMLYGNSSLREYTDLDVMVHSEDVPASRDLLIELGYTSEFTGSNPATAPVTRFGGELTFCQDGFHPIDLHWDLSAELMPSPLDTKEVWERTSSVDLNGVAVGTLGLEDQIVYLCYHGGKHLWCSLSQVCDVGWLVANHPEVDWDATLDLARRHGSERLVLLGLQLAADLLSVEIPEPARRRLSGRKDVRAAADAREKWLMQGGDGVEEARTPALFGLLETPAQKFRYAVSVALVPTLAEWRAWRLPERLYWIYYPFRIVRLAWKYASIGIARLGRRN